MIPFNLKSFDSYYAKYNDEIYKEAIHSGSLTFWRRVKYVLRLTYKLISDKRSVDEYNLDYMQQMYDSVTKEITSVKLIEDSLLTDVENMTKFITIDARNKANIPEIASDLWIQNTAKNYFTIFIVDDGNVKQFSNFYTVNTANNQCIVYVFNITTSKFDTYTIGSSGAVSYKAG